MLRTTCFAALLSAGCLAAAEERPTAWIMTGFSAASAVVERDREQQFDSAMDSVEMQGWLKRLTAAPNHVGSPHNKANAEFIAQLFQSWGWEVQIETFRVLYPTPKTQRLELLAPRRFVAGLREPPIAEDHTSRSADSLPPYAVYGADGDVTAGLVYVNYGLPNDYRELARRGIDVRGKIVITRYGGGWRGLKPKLAQEHGAVGCIIYSDPHEDGYGAGDPYPSGGYRPAQGLQRGSVLDSSVIPGDPLTPGIGATNDAKRIARADAVPIMRIPTIPISYADAEPLLVALGGPVAPADWRGSLPLTYHIGPGEARVHLKVESDWCLTPVYDVIARIPGSESPDEWVLRGNHRDAWVHGAWDPYSGVVAELAEAKAIGGLVRRGWRPKRTLIYASWDGEEPGLLGSTEWVETHSDELARKAVLYVNTDDTGRGFLDAMGSPAFQHLVNEVADGVKDPETGVSVLTRLRARVMVQAHEEDKHNAATDSHGGGLPLRPIGSGSDFTPFTHHLGIASLSLQYTGEEDQSGVYHSLYDSFDHYLRFGDPGLVYGVLLAETCGHLILRTANADILPLQFTDFADALENYRGEVHRLAEDLRKRSEELSALLDQRAYELAADPTRPVKAPEREPEVPYLNFAPMDNAVARLRKGAASYDDAFRRMMASNALPSGLHRLALNEQLQGIEQALADARGLPGRPWYRNLVYAPGLLTGYAAKTLPGVREALEGSRYGEANEYVLMTAGVIDAYAARVEGATQLLIQDEPQRRF